MVSSEVHPANISEELVTLITSNPSTLIELRDEQPRNIEFITVTALVFRFSMPTISVSFSNRENHA